MSYIEIINIIQWLASIIAIILIIYLSFRVQNSSSRYLTGFLLCTAIWSFFAALTLLSESLEVKIFLNRLKMIGPIFIPYLVLRIAEGANKEIKIPDIFMRGLFYVALVFLGINLSSYHELIIRDYGILEIMGYGILTFENGKLFFIHNILARISIATAIIVLFIGHGQKHPHHKKNSILIFLAFLGPFVIDNVGVFFYEYIRFLQLVPVSFTLTGLILVYLLHHRKVLEIEPYTRSRIVDSLVEPCFMWGKDGVLVDCNQAASDLFNLSDSLFRFDEKMFPSLKKDNSEFYFRNTYFKVKYQKLNTSLDSGEAFTILNDITSEKKVALEMAKLNEVKSSLLGILSHDLTGHIGQLSFIAEILSKDIEKLNITDREQLSKNLGDISEDVRVFIQDILEWSKEQKGDWVSGRESFNVEKLLETVVNFMRLIAESKEVQIHVMESQSVEIKTDQMMSAIIFRNLVYNAIKHSPAGSDISVSLQKDRLLISNRANIKIAEKLNDYIQNDESVHSGGLGLKLVREFSSILNMKVSFTQCENLLVTKVSWI